MDRLVLGIKAIDKVNEGVGKTVAWLTLATVLVCGGVVALRYTAGVGYVWMQELYVWMHAAVFMLCAGYAFLRNAHVRVDIFYASASERTKAWIDLFGVIFLLFPWLALIIWAGWDYVAYSWVIREISVQNNGMVGVFVLKSTIIGFAVLLGLQGLAWIGRCILVIRGREAPPAEGLSGPTG